MFIWVALLAVHSVAFLRKLEGGEKIWGCNTENWGKEGNSPKHEYLKKKRKRIIMCGAKKKQQSTNVHIKYPSNFSPQLVALRSSSAAAVYLSPLSSAFASVKNIFRSVIPSPTNGDAWAIEGTRRMERLVLRSVEKHSTEVLQSKEHVR